MNLLPSIWKKWHRVEKNLHSRGVTYIGYDCFVDSSPMMAREESNMKLGDYTIYVGALKDNWLRGTLMDI